MRHLAAAATGLLLTACSASATAPAVPPSPHAEGIAAAASPSSSHSPIGGNVLPPIEIDGQKSETVRVGDTLNVTTPGVTGVTTDNADVLGVSQPRDDGLATFNGGAKVLAPGTAKLVVSGDQGKLYVVTVSAAE